MYDVTIIGCGIMGASCAWRLSKSGLKVAAIDQFQMGHSHGSSHGQTRMIRQAYFEHPNYVPLLMKAYSLWDELDKEWANHQHFQRKIFHKVGLWVYGANDSSIIEGIQRSATEHQLPIQISPWHDSSSNEGLKIFEANAGFLDTEQAIAGLKQCSLNNVDFFEQEEVLSYKQLEFSIEVKTSKRTFFTKKIVITTGSWTKHFIKERPIPLKIYRNYLYWFKPTTNFQLKNCFGYHLDEGFFYGFPNDQEGFIKIALHLRGDELNHPCEKESKLPGRDLPILQNFISKYFPELNPKPVHFANCIYEMSPDEHFMIDFINGNTNMIAACGFSGHGFKFGPAIGDLVYEMATKEQIPDLARFLKFRS